MPEQALRVGVIGVMDAETVHIPGLRQIPQVDIVAVCATAGESAASVATRFRIPGRFADYKEMLREAELDAVAIAAPLEFHHPIVIAAVEQQLHILCASPMARSAAEARDMHRLACSLGVHHAVGYAARYLPSRSHVKRLIDSGYLGDLQTVSVTVQRPPKPRPSDESLMQEVGSEYVDALRWWFGEIHGVVGAVAASQPGDVAASQPKSNFAILVRFASGAIGTIHASATSPFDTREEIVAIGTGGMLTLKGDKLFAGRRDEPMLSELPLPEDLALRLLQAPDPRVGPFAELAHDWVRSIVERETPCQAPTFEDGMRVQEIVDGALRSQDLGRWIDTSGRKWPM